jgi:predicted DNA-binding protein with PD1-like motif
MEIHVLSAAVPNRMFPLVFSAGDEVCDGLLTFARQQPITAASFTAIGALQHTVVAFSIRIAANTSASHSTNRSRC